jgi:hypothetical protein
MPTEQLFGKRVEALELGGRPILPRLEIPASAFDDGFFSHGAPPGGGCSEDTTGGADAILNFEFSSLNSQQTPRRTSEAAVNNSKFKIKN